MKRRFSRITFLFILILVPLLLSSAGVNAQYGDDDDGSTGGDLFGSMMCCLLYGIVSIGGLVMWIFILIWVNKDAKGRGMKNPGLWVLIVFLVGWIGLIIYLCVRPSGKKVYCPACRKPSLKTLYRCPFCGKSKILGGQSLEPSGYGGPLAGMTKTCPKCGTDAPLSTTICPNCYWNM